MSTETRETWNAAKADYLANAVDNEIYNGGVPYFLVDDEDVIRYTHAVMEEDRVVLDMEGYRE